MLRTEIKSTHTVKNGEIPHQSSIVFHLFLSHGCLYEGVPSRVDSVPLEEPVNDAAGHDVTCSF